MGQITTADRYDANNATTCSAGIHFFLHANQAKSYNDGGHIFGSVVAELEQRGYDYLATMDLSDLKLPPVVCIKATHAPPSARSIVRLPRVLRSEGKRCNLM
jgi:phosphoribosylpyrophosphate synthetase